MTHAVYGENQQQSQNALSSKTIQAFQTFTGKVTGNNVRIRIAPNLNSTIVTEVNQDDLLLVMDDANDFYGIMPPASMKAYVFRTFVLDNVIEGTNVNVRLGPNLESPIIANLNTGYPIVGTICETNRKWLEIEPPKNARLYITKDYIEYAGDTTYLVTFNERNEAVRDALYSAMEMSQQELGKPFENINFDKVQNRFDAIIAEYPEFSSFVTQANDAATQAKHTYMQKKLAFLENQSSHSSSIWKEKTAHLNDKLSKYEQRVDALEKHVITNTMDVGIDNTMLTDTMSTMITNSWEPKEMRLFETWQLSETDNNNKSLNEFYASQSTQARIISGILEPYSALVNNKPGDFIVQKNNVPVAYVYSTTLDLNDHIGEQVTLVGLPRENNNFAFPAYFALSIR